MKKNCADGVKAGVALHLVAKKGVNKPETSELSAWTLEPHVCKVCFGRMASRPATGNCVQLLCTNCGATGVHESVTAGCCCGIVRRKRNSIGRSGGPMIDAGIRCILNPERTPAFPSMFVAREVIKQNKA